MTTCASVAPRATTLRRRLLAASFVFIAVVCGLCGVGMLVAFEAAEERLFDRHREREIAGLVAIYEHDAAMLEVAQANFTVHAVRAGDKSGLPPDLRDLTADDDELVRDGREYHVQLETRGDTTYYFLLDESDFEAFEALLQRSLLLAVLAVVVIAVLLALGLARRVSRPLTALARAVAALDARAPVEHGLTLDVGADREVAALGQAIGHYHRRLRELLHREREFSADVSHELRTPLTAIRGAGELIEARALRDEELRALAARIRRGCQRMSALIEALLYLARDPASYGDALEPTALGEAVVAQIDALAELARGRGVRVDVEMQAASVSVVAIPSVLDVVLGNVLRNAVKYTDHDRVTVRVEGDAVVIQDYGPGIARVAQVSLFERYERAGRAGGDGEGIGLALVRRFCQQFGWRLEFASEVGRGTRVVIGFGAGAAAATPTVHTA